MPAKKRSPGVPTPAATPNATFSLRLQPADYKALTYLANLKKLSIAELAREYILDGMRRSLDPDEIQKELDREKERLLKAAEEMQAWRTQAEEKLKSEGARSPQEEDV